MDSILVIFALLNLLFFLLKAASEIALVVLAAVAAKALRHYVRGPNPPEQVGRFKRAFRAAKVELFKKK